MPATRWRPPPPTSSRAPTRSCSSTCRQPPKGEVTPWRPWRGCGRCCRSRSPWVAGSAGSTTPGGCSTPGPTRSGPTPPRCDDPTSSGRSPGGSGRSAPWWRSTPPPPAGLGGRGRQRRHPHRARRRGVVRQGNGARGRGDPAHQLGPRRHPERVRHRPARGGVGCGHRAGDRLGWRRHRRTPGRRSAAGAAAVLVASILHDGITTVGALKASLAAAGVRVRP